MWIELRQCDDEGFLYNVSGVLLVQPVLPSCAPNKRQEELQIELVETRGVDRPEYRGSNGVGVFPLGTHEV